MAPTSSPRSQTLLAPFWNHWMRWGLTLIAGLTTTAGCDGNGGTAVDPAYTLSLTQVALTIDQGANSNTTVTLSRTTFTEAVTLSLGNAPAGVTGSFNPAAPTGTSSTLTVSVGAAVAPGIYNLTVDGSSTLSDRSTPLTLTVNAPPDYGLSLTPAALTIIQGANGNTAVTLTRTNFTGAVTLSLGGAPAGVTGSFNPAAPTGTSSTLTVSVGAAVAPGVYNLTVDGAATAGNHSTPLTLTVSAAAANYALSLTPTALTIAPSAKGNTAVALTRTNFTGAVTLSLGGAPAGVTGSFNPAAPTGTSSTLTVSVGAAVAPGVYNLTVDGTGTAGNRSTPLTLMVPLPPGYALLPLNPASLTIPQGANGNAAVSIFRLGFTGAVTLSLGNAPAGVTGLFNPAAPTGTSSTLTVSVGAAVAPGVYNLTVDGTATAGNRSTPLALTVTGASGGNVTVDFSACTVAEQPLWLASQDGTGAWGVVTGVNNVYQFSITSGRGGLAYVVSSAGTTSTAVQYMTQAEFTGSPLVFCGATPTGKTINGTAAGITALDQTIISLGGGAALPTAASLNFQITGVASGTHDLVGYRRSLVGGAEAAIIRRDQNIADNGSVGTMDFGGAEAFVPATATITVGGLVGGETVLQSMLYQVGASCTAASLYTGGLGGATFTASGIPAVQQRASDFHGSSITAIGASNDLRSTIEYFHTLAARTVSLGAAMPTPTVTQLSGPYKRLQAVYTLPAEYNTSTSFSYDDGAGLSVSLTATFGYLGGAATTLALADYSALAGWTNTWVPASASSGPWIAFGSGNNITTSVCVDNASVKFASVNGTF